MSNFPKEHRFSSSIKRATAEFRVDGCRSIYQENEEGSEVLRAAVRAARDAFDEIYHGKKIHRSIPKAPPV